MFTLKRSHVIQITGIYLFIIVTGICSHNFKKLWGPVKKRGFECMDDTLRKPYLEDTIPPKDLYIISVYIPICIMIFCEFIRNLIERKKPGNELKWLKRCILNIAVILTSFIFGFTVERLLKNVAKYKMGRLRPHFIEKCKPINTDGYSCEYMLSTAAFMDDYECSSKDASTSLFLSFPSGHSSLIFYGMIYMACYLRQLSQRLQHVKTPFDILIPIMQISSIFLACCVAMSRVLDYKHHWSDVIGGLIWGSSVALAVSLYMKRQQQNIDNIIEDIVKPELASAGVDTSSLAKKELHKESCIVVLNKD